MSDAPEIGTARRAGRAVTWRALAYITSRGLSSLRTLILGWLLTPADFGTLAVGLAALEVLLSLTNFGFDQAVIQTQDPTRDHYDVAWSMKLIRSIAITVVLVLGSGVVANLYGQPDAASVVAVLAIRPIFDAGASVGLVALRKRLEFKELAITGLARGLTDIVLALALASWLGVWALVIGQVVGAFAALIVSYLVAPWRPRLLLRAEIRRALLRFGRWIFVGVAVATAMSALLQLVVSRQLGPEALGALYMAMRLGMLVSSAVGFILADVGLSLHAESQNESERRATLLRTTTLSMLAFLAPGSLVVAAIADRFLPALIGPNWDLAVWPTAIILISGIVAVYQDAVIPMFLGTGHPAYKAALEVLRFAVVVPVALVVTGEWQVTGAAIALLAGEVAVLALAAIQTKQLLPFGLPNLVPPVIVVLLLSGIGAAAGLGLSRLAPGNVGAWLSVVGGMVVAYGLVLAADDRLGLSLRRMVAAALPRASRLLRVTH